MMTGRHFLSCIPMMFFLSIAFGETTPSGQEIDSLTQKALSEWDIPGVGLAVVYKGKPLRISGYGVKKRGATDPVTEDTLFQIASLTKAFTAASVGMVVEEGKLEWEKPIKGYLPTFQLKDEYASQEMTLRDLLSHRTGLPGTSKECWRLWYHTNRSTDELIRRLKDVDPAYPFRSHFSYNNMAYVVASKVVEKVSGIPWEEFCEKRLFAPLGMTRTTFSHAFLVEDRNVASAHLTRSIQEEPIPWENWENIAAAGGINTSAKDMAAWLFYCLSKPNALKEAQKPETLMEAEGLLGPVSNLTWPLYAHGQQIVAYGFGWMMYSLGDKTILYHTGLTDGMQAIVAVVPEEQLGIAILTNQAPHLGAVCLLNELLDRFLHQSHVSWHKKGHAVVAEMTRLVESKKRASGISLPALPLQEYVGTYEHPAYGALSIVLVDDQLELVLWTQEKGMLKCRDTNTFELLDSSLDLPSTLEFELSQDKTFVDRLKIPDLGVFKRKTIFQAK